MKVDGKINMKYHIMYSDTVILPDGEKVKVSELHFEEPKHEYDIGTRHHYGRPREIPETEETEKFLEDYMVEGNFVQILEVGASTYRFENQPKVFSGFPIINRNK